MSRSRRLVCAGLCVVALACSGRKDSPTPAPEPSPVRAPAIDAAPPVVVGPSAPVWLRAPTAAVAGLVVPQGALGKLLSSWELAREAAASDPFWAGLLAGGDSLVRQAIADRRDAGPARPLAVFFDRDGALLGDLGVLGAAPAKPSSLAALSGKLPGLRGDLELRVDPSRVRGFRVLLDRLEQQLIAGADAWGAALTVQGAVATLDLQMTGQPVAPWSELFAEPTDIAGISSRRQASTTALSLRVHPRAIAAWAGTVGVAPELIAALSGDLGIFLRKPSAAEPVVIELALGVTDRAGAKRSIGPLCNALLRPFGPIEELAAGVCRVRIAAPSEAAGGRWGRALLAAVAGRQVVLEVVGDVLVVRMGAVALAPTPEPASSDPRSRGAAAPSPNGRPGAVPWQLWLSSRSTEVLALLPGLAEAVDPPVMRSLQWFGAHTGDLEIGLRVGARGVHCRIRITARASRQPPSQQ